MTQDRHRLSRIKTLDEDASSESLWALEDLATFLNLKSTDAARKMVARKQIPPACVIRIGRRLRFLPWRIKQWLGISGENEVPEGKREDR